MAQCFMLVISHLVTSTQSNYPKGDSHNLAENVVFTKSCATLGMLGNILSTLCTCTSFVPALKKSAPLADPCLEHLEAGLKSKRGEIITIWKAYLDFKSGRC